VVLFALLFLVIMGRPPQLVGAGPFEWSLFEFVSSQVNIRSSHFGILPAPWNTKESSTSSFN
jgi:hypothetical protein